MGSTVTVLTPKRMEEGALVRVQQLFQEWERRLSQFRDDSELTRVNRSAGAVVPVSSLFFRAASHSGGASHRWHVLSSAGPSIGFFRL